MERSRHALLFSVLVSGLLALPVAAKAQQLKCPVSHDQLKSALDDSVKVAGGPMEGGLPVNEWAAVVNRAGEVCAIAYSGKGPTDQWLGSRAIAVEKANAVNDFSLNKYAISTANLWASSQSGGSLYGLIVGNPPVPQELYSGKLSNYGTVNDPLLGRRPGGVIVFGGGLALYDQSGMIGGIGASGNTSCADHNIAWRMREKLGLDKVPNGPSSAHNDAIVYDVGSDGKSQSGWGHPECRGNAVQIAKKIGSGYVVATPQKRAAR
jgi:hypothetical protein